MGEGNAGNHGLLGDTSSGDGQVLDGGGTNSIDNAKEKIEEFDWDGLEERFWARMEECKRVEEGIMEEFGELLEVCLFPLFHRSICSGDGPSCTGGSFADGICATK